VSPNVLAVGGTTLTLDDAGNYQLEAPWLFSGGGISFYEPRPFYQTGTPSSDMRSNPDVAFDADPRSGFAIYDTVGISQRSGWLQVGGTSAGAPQWAALIAIADQGRALVGNGSLDGVTQTLSAIYALPSSVFHTPYSAFGTLIPGSTYSLETGRGSPIANLLIPALPGMSPPAPVAHAPGSEQPPVADAPGSPAPPAPPKTTPPPKKSDPAHQLADVHGFPTDTPALTVAALTSATLTPSQVVDIRLAILPHSAEDPIITGTGSLSDRHDLLEGKSKDNLEFLPADPDDQESTEDQLPQVSLSMLSPSYITVDSQIPIRQSKLEYPRVVIRELGSEIPNSRPQVGVASISLWIFDFEFWTFSLAGLAALMAAKLMEPRWRYDLEVISPKQRST